MKRGAFFALAAILVGCGGMPSPMGKTNGNGGGGGGYVMPAMSPFMYAKDFSAYEAGKWVHYKQEPGGMETIIKCVGKDGDLTWIEFGMKMPSMEYAHLLQVGKDGKVAKAWYSGKDDKEWKEAKVNESPATTGGTGEMPKECAKCKKPFADHKKPDIKKGDEKVDVGGKSVACTKLEVTTYDCDGAKAATMTYHVSGDVPNLHQMYAMMLKMYNAPGSLVKMDMGSMKVMLADFGADAKPKHELPKK